MIEPTDVTAIVEAILEVNVTLSVLSVLLVMSIFGHALMTKK